ncbi:hypothetical protein BD626DRAFT_563294 [Schizophyllum amplum]|uniref:Uncharacterized protein n=1 Tax=Schizophyllum amplum TaxID=97359 RepID=A0A550CXP5_9AGAR|nr:hypothetical protein BD626DRAFT_563294 [Auriculariopsis ampla]
MGAIVSCLGFTLSAIFAGITGFITACAGLAMSIAMFFQDLFCGCRPGAHIQERNEKRRHVRVVSQPSHPLAPSPMEVQSPKL